jgi:SNF2 family DNA or RNA helicase
MMKNHELRDAGFQLTVFDESSKLKNIKAQVTKRAIAWADTQRFVYLLSGTPAPNSELEYWPQVRCVDQTVWGHSFYGWRPRYFYPTGFENHVWKIQPEQKSKLFYDLASVSEVVRREDVLDLPERTFNVREVTLDEAEARAYKDMKSRAILEIESEKIKAVNAGAKLMKLREGTSGFYLDEDGRAHDVGKSKLNELADLLDEIGDHQVLIWFHFHHEGDLISRLLTTRAGVQSWGRVDGTVGSQYVKDEWVRRFQTGEIKYLLAHPASLGHGVTLVNCVYAIYFSLSHSLELHQQSQDRIYRKGQTRPCSYYFLAAKGTVDGAIMNALARKKKVVDEVMDFIMGGKNVG